MRIKGFNNNAEYAVDGLKAYIESTKDIQPGSEIFVDYGPDYWKTMRENLAIDKKAKREADKKAKRKRRKSNYFSCERIRFSSSYASAAKSSNPIRVASEIYAINNLIDPGLTCLASARIVYALSLSAE